MSNFSRDAYGAYFLGHNDYSDVPREPIDECMAIIYTFYNRRLGIDDGRKRIWEPLSINEKDELHSLVQKSDAYSYLTQAQRDFVRIKIL